MRKSRQTLLTFMGLGLGAMVVVYAAELGLAAGLGGPSIASWDIENGAQAHKDERVKIARTVGVEMDTRDRVDVVADLRKREIDAVQGVLTIDLLTSEKALKSDDARNDGQLVPLGGVSSAVTVLCNESGKYVSYQSDEHGFQNPAGSWSMGRADIATVGQSHVQGYCVDQGKGFVDLLRPRFPATLNVGNSGQATVLQLAAIREYLPTYKPSVVLWFFSEGLDLPDLHDEAIHPFAKRYLDPGFSQQLLGRQTEIDAALRAYLARKDVRDRRRRARNQERPLKDESLRVLKLWDLRERLNLILGRDAEYVNGMATLEPPEHSLFSQVLAQAQSTTQSWGGTLYVVYLPSWSRYVNGPIAVERERTKVLAELNALHIPTIDVTAAFQAEKDPLSMFWFRRAVHFTDAGHQLIADTVLKELSRRGVGPARPSAGNNDN